MKTFQVVRRGSKWHVHIPDASRGVHDSEDKDVSLPGHARKRGDSVVKYGYWIVLASSKRSTRTSTASKFVKNPANQFRADGICGERSQSSANGSRTE